MKSCRVDVIVVGGGPAGCAAATAAAEAGKDVLLLEGRSFPRDKPCGDGVAPRAVAALQALGVEDRIRGLGYLPVADYRLVSSWGEAVRAGLPSFGKGAGYAYVVPRRELDALLVERAREAGARVEEGVWVTGREEGTDSLIVQGYAAGGEAVTVRASVAVGADGSRGSFSRRVMGKGPLVPDAVGIRAYAEGVEELDGALNFFLDRHLLPGYGWIFPPGGEGRPANVGVGMDRASLRKSSRKGTGGLKLLLQWFLGPDSAAGSYTRNLRLVSTPVPFPLQFDFRAGRRRTGRVLFCGDAANLINPLSGEGIAYALESGRMAGTAAAGAVEEGEEELRRYEDAVANNQGNEFRYSGLLKQLLVRSWGNGAAIRLLRRDDGLARGGMGILANTVPLGWLTRPVVWGRVFAPHRLHDILHKTHPAAG